jgi:hypothetical protein
MKFIASKQLATYILNNIDESEIFAYYLDVPITEIYKCINNHTYRVCNNLRGDRNPSFGLQYYNISGKTKLYGKDFADPSYTGDCFHLVGMALNLHCNNPKDFIEICKDIIKRILNNDYSKRVLHINKSVKQDVIRLIDVKLRNYDEHDLKYWGAYGITSETLIKEKIYPVDSFYIDNQYQDYYYEPTNPAYAYYLGNNIYPLWEIYRPKELKYFKFRTNNNSDLKELHLVSKHNNLIITKSKKDKALISQIISELGIYSTQVLYASESTVLKQSTRLIIKENYRNVFVNFDLDIPGIKAMKYFNSEYKYKVFPFTDKNLIASISNHPKDISDFSFRFGYDITKKLFNYLFNKYNP